MRLGGRAALSLASSYFYAAITDRASADEEKITIRELMGIMQPKLETNGIKKEG
jgi:hypothetical protein